MMKTGKYEGKLKVILIISEMFKLEIIKEQRIETGEAVLQKMLHGK